MLGMHLLLAVAIAAFSNALSPLGITMAFVLVYLVLKLGAVMMGANPYVRRLELGIRFVFWYGLEVVKASIDVARVVFSANCQPSPAIVKMKLRYPEERVATLIGCLLTLTPGTMALDYNADSGEMFIHALDAEDAEGVISSVREIETRLLEWMGIEAGPAEEAIDLDRAEKESV